MLVAIILGNRLNDDGSMSTILQRRMAMAIKVDKLFNPDKIIVSGGVANKATKVSEAQVMYDYLVNNGIASGKLIKEDRSLSTEQNAQFSVPLAVSLHAEEILLCTSTEHMKRKYLNPINLFEKQIALHGNIKLSAYCE